MSRRALALGVLTAPVLLITLDMTVLGAALPAISEDLRPGAATQLCCRLRNFDVYGDTEYQAVSYAWGEPRFTELLVVDEDYYLMTTPNFRDALLRFRLPDWPRRLWVDAVCINQKDEEEKGLSSS